uniref:Uncharacterized protein n=1 Tax=Arundo donax TaxID=35708 RepID=A0A0A9AJ00_ARUDO
MDHEYKVQSSEFSVMDIFEPWFGWTVIPIVPNI